MVIDAIIYNGERDIFDLRYAILKDVVDEFVVVEFGQTFSGQPKEAHPINLPKVSYHFFTQVKDWKPNLPHGFYGEYNQREMIKVCLAHLNDDDLVFVSDYDEIWEPQVVDLLTNYGNPHDGLIRKQKLRNYAYYLNNRSSENFALGPIVGRYRDIKDKQLNYLRSNTPLSTDYYGWHFTNCQPYEYVLNKLATAGHQEFNTLEIKGALKDRMDNNIDYIGRNFIFTIDESDLPEEIINNRDKYKHLLK